MCSGCSGNYESDSEDWGPPSASCDDTIGGDPFGRDDTRNQRPACEYQAESEYEVLVSADQIIEIHRIGGNFAGLS
jgi:hypothetical protein